MRILQINNFEAIGGGSDRVYQLNTRMLLDRGHEVATLACGELSFDDRKHSILLKRNGYIERSPLKTLKNVKDFIYREEAATAIQRLLREFRPEVAHLHIFYGQLSNAVLKALSQAKVPTVMTVHEYRMLCPVSTLYNERRGVCERCAHGNHLHAVLGRCNRGSVLASSLSALEAWTRDRHYRYTEHIDHFFMVSKFCRDKHVQYQPEIAQKSSVLYNFVSNKDIATAPQELASSAPYLYCGRLSSEKGLALLCEAFAQRPTLSLRIAGGGPLADELASRYGQLPNIRFLGKLDGVALKKELREAKYSIAPSEWYENNPMAILESFAQGTPVLGAAIGGIPELVIEGRTGSLFEPSDLGSLLQALDRAANASASARMEQGRQAIALIQERHDEKAHYQHLTEAYMKAVRRRGLESAA